MRTVLWSHGLAARAHALLEKRLICLFLPQAKQERARIGETGV